MEWETVDRPGYFGKDRDEIHKEYDKKYGKGNWKIGWIFSKAIIPFERACLIYEDGYYHDSFEREDLWKELIETAKDVYDIGIFDIESKLDYSIQNESATHLQDISIRRVVLRRGWKFQGEELIQIRGDKTELGKKLNPGKVPFHMPELITFHKKGWWNRYSIEDWYQSQKVIQVKT